MHEGSRSTDSFFSSQRISLFVDYEKDESYAPSKIAVYAGSHFHDLVVSVKRWLFGCYATPNISFIAKLPYSR